MRFSSYVMKRLSCIFCVCLLSLVPLSGEVLPDLVQVEITTLAWQKPVSELYFLNDGAIQERKAYTGGFSMPFAYKGPVTLQLYADRSVFSLEPAERPQPVAVAQLPSGIKEAMLVFIPSGAGQYKVMVWDASLDGFPAQSYRVYNLSSTRVAFAIGDTPKVYTIEPRAMQLVRQAGLIQDRQMVKVQIAQDAQGGMSLAYRSLWSVGADTRSTVFILPRSEGRKGVKILKYTQRGID